MMTVGDIQNVTFERSMRGYRAEDVDEFLSKMAQEFDAVIAQRDDALREKDEAIAAAARDKESSEKKLYILAEKIEQYRADEENLKVALLNAQRLGETVVYEAKQKAESIVYEAKTKAAQVHEELKSQQAAEEAKLSQMRSEVTKFKAEVLELYKRHIELLTSLPSQDEKKTAPIVFTVSDTQTAAAKAAAESDKPVAAGTQSVEETKESISHTKRKAAKPTDSVQVEQGTFDFEHHSGEVHQDSFENYQGIRFDE